MQLKFKRLKSGAKTPIRATSGAAAADLYALCDEDIIIESGKRALVPTGIAIELPSAEYVALIFARSGLAINYGLTLSNAVGVIDSDYRGEICVGLVNLSQETYIVKNGERIAQLAVMPVMLFDMQEVNELSSTKRNEGGFGSTGKA